jgi:hypothetical protein
MQDSQRTARSEPLRAAARAMQASSALAQGVYRHGNVASAAFCRSATTASGHSTRPDDDSITWTLGTLSPRNSCDQTCAPEAVRIGGSDGKLQRAAVLDRPLMPGMMITRTLTSPWGTLQHERCVAGVKATSRQALVHRGTRRKHTACIWPCQDGTVWAHNVTTKRP